MSTEQQQSQEPEHGHGRSHGQQQQQPQDGSTGHGSDSAMEHMKEREHWREMDRAVRRPDARK